MCFSGDRDGDRALVGEVGVEVVPRAAAADGDLVRGDSGRRNGDARGEPKGIGLEGDCDWRAVSWCGGSDGGDGGDGMAERNVPWCIDTIQSLDLLMQCL